ncbi:MAG: hypothetical protein K2O06_13720 [Acetatifactor sp.]|nr:hypothetical protein [Acetatifactor sp.]
MNNRNRFIKLLTISVDKQDLLLYGFSVPTEQAPRPWKKRRDKRKLDVCSAILPPEVAENFEQRLTGEESILLADLTLHVLGLVPRKPVLSCGTDWKAPAPVSQLSRVHELWNTQKEDLVQQLQTASGSHGKALYQDIQTLLAQLREECGVDFSQHGARLGNYEHYDNVPLSCPLEVHCDKASEGKRMLVKKPANWARPLVVNCAARQLERVLFNQVRFLGPEDAQAEFTAEETIGLYTVYAWDQETGDLVFFKSSSLCNQMTFDFSMSGPSRVIRDPWTESLHSAARNRSKVIHEQIETVQHRSSDRSIHIGGKAPITVAARAGKQLLSPYGTKPCKGTFIPRNQKDGEISSFLKIQEYLEQGSVCRAVIADPYFSVPTAAKMLSKIKNTNLELTVVTSLTDTDPDTQEKKSVAAAYQKFLQNNFLVLHERLRLCNLYRGKDQVLHDRYLIRYHADEHIDGFLLSNSLNSMGQFYPFVIAPLEPEVCLSVAEYLKQLQDEEFQKKQPKSERISCQVLYDYRDRFSAKDPPSEEPAGQEWLARWKDRRIPTEELPDVLNAVLCHRDESPEAVYRALSLLGGRTYPWTAADLAALLRANPAVMEGYIDWFSAKVREVEGTRRHQGIESDVQEFTLWSLLAGKSEPDRVGFKQLLEYSHCVYYQGCGWMSGGSCLLLALDPARFTVLMEETCSPLMLGCLAQRLGIWSWSESLYRCLLGSENSCVRLLAVHWPIVLLDRERGGLTPKAVLTLLDSLEPGLRLLQSTRLLSEAAFCIRNPRPAPGCWPDLLPSLIDCTATALPLCTLDERQTGLHWLHDCEACSQCALYLEVAAQLEKGALQDELLEKAVNTIQKYLAAPRYDHDDISRHITLCLDALEARFGSQAEQELHKRLVDWTAFETATEPALRDYDYNRWSHAHLRARWQIQLLRAFLERSPQAEDTQKCLNLWENRVKIMS